MIYVYAKGYLGNPDLVETAPHLQEVFGRMGMSESKCVALIGGHAFGKADGEGCFSNDTVVLKDNGQHIHLIVIMNIVYTIMIW